MKRLSRSDRALLDSAWAELARAPKTYSGRSDSTRSAVFVAKYGGMCARCGRAISVGDDIRYHDGLTVRCMTGAVPRRRGRPDAEHEPPVHQAALLSAHSATPNTVGRVGEAVTMKNWSSDGTLNIDPDRKVSLRDVGGVDYLLGFAVGPGGAVTFFLYDATLSGDTTVVLDIRKWPRHERLGPLLHRDWRRCLTVLWTPPRHRCLRRTRYGDPCLARVGAPGGACRYHRDAGESRGDGGDR